MGVELDFVNYDCIISDDWDAFVNAFSDANDLFVRLKQFRSIATRYEKLAHNFKSML